MINIYKHQRLSLEVTAIMIIILAACDGASTGSQNSNESNADLLKMGVNNMKNARSYHLDVDSNTDSRVSKITGDIDVTNKNSKLDLNEGGLIRTYISIGSDNYISTDGGKSFSKGLQSLAGTVNQFEGIWSKVDAIEVDKNKDALSITASVVREKVVVTIGIAVGRQGVCDSPLHQSDPFALSEAVILETVLKLAG